MDMRILVVGVGAMGWNHSRVCSELGLLAGVCDMNEESVKSVAEHFGVPGFTSVSHAISEINPDAVIVATPTFTHAEIATEALNSGLHVLVEKPLAIDIESAEKVVALAREKKLKLAVGHIERHNPVIAMARNNLKSGEWGDVLTISSRRVSNFPGRIKDVGVILDLGIHDIDNVLHLMGSKLTSVFTRAGSYNTVNHEDHANIILGFEDGKSAMLEVNWITPMRVRTLSLTCEDSFVELDYMRQQGSVSTSRFTNPEDKQQYPVKIEYDTKIISLQRQEPLKIEIQDFVDSIVNDREPLVTGEEGVYSLRATIAAVESWQTGKVIDFE